MLLRFPRPPLPAFIAQARKGFGAETTTVLHAYHGVHSLETAVRTWFAHPLRTVSP